MSGPLDFEPPKPGGGGAGEGGSEENRPQPAAGAREPEVEGRPGGSLPVPPPVERRTGALPEGPPPPARPPGASRYGWLVGVLVVVILAYILQNTLRSNHLRAAGPEPGTQLHPFAAPLLLSTLNGDANVDVKRACGVHLRGALNSCDVERRGPVVLGFLFTRGAHCQGSFDAMQRLGATMPGVQFVGVIVRGDRAAEAKLARQHGWTFPLVFDHDGGLADVYGVAGCPEVVLAYPGGKVRETVLGGDRAERRLGQHVAALVAASKRRGWKAPA